MSSTFNWIIPEGITPICFTGVYYNVKNTSTFVAMDSWSVEEIDLDTFALNFRTLSSEAGSTVNCYYNDIKIGVLTLEHMSIDYGVFYTIRIKYPVNKVMLGNDELYSEYKKIILKSQANPSYPVFAYNSHTHLNLWSPENNKYIATIKENPLVNEFGSISAGSSDLINSNTLITQPSIEYITPIVNDIYDFR